MTTLANLRIGFIGYGKLARALAWNYVDAGLTVTGASNGTHSDIPDHSLPPSCINFQSLEELLQAVDLIFITSPDSEISTISDSLSWSPEHIVVHCSGTLESSILNHADTQGAKTGIFHPLQTVSKTQNLENYIGIFTSVTFGITSRFESVRNTLSQLSTLLDGCWINIADEMKTPYHIAAVMACGHITTLLELSNSIMTKAGLTRLESTEALKTIVNTTIDNYFVQGARSLTGPAARHDKTTVLRHIDWLRENDPSILETYANLTRHSTQMISNRDDASSTQMQEDQ